MRQPVRRLSYAEAKQIEETSGRICRVCRTVYPPDQIAASFGADARTRDGLSRLCLACIERRDAATERRMRGSQTDAQAEYHSVLREMRIIATREQLEEQLPQHGVPEYALPDYPTPAAAPVGPRQEAIYTRLYGMLRDAGVKHWEQIAGTSRNKVRENIDRIGPGSLKLIDEHLRAFDLEPLKP